MLVCHGFHCLGLLDTEVLTSLVSSFVSTILDPLPVLPLDSATGSAVVSDSGGISKLILSWTPLSSFSLFGRGAQSKDHHEKPHQTPRSLKCMRSLWKDQHNSIPSSLSHIRQKCTEVLSYQICYANGWEQTHNKLIQKL